MGNGPQSRRTILVEVEVPPLALLANPAGDWSAATHDDLGVAISDLGTMRPAGDAWAAAPSASTPTAAQPCADAGANVVRFCCELPIPEPGQSRVSRLSVQRAHTAADGSGATWNAALHPTEEELIAIIAATEGAAPERAAPLVWPLTGRPGKSRDIPGVHVLHVALSLDGDVTRAWLADAGDHSPGA